MELLEKAQNETKVSVVREGRQHLWQLRVEGLKGKLDSTEGIVFVYNSTSPAQAAQWEGRLFTPPCIQVQTHKQCAEGGKYKRKERKL